MPVLSNKIDVLVVNSNVLLRQMLSQILREEVNIADVQTMVNSENGNTLLEIEKRRPDALFLGIESVNSPEMYLLKSIINTFPEIPVFSLTPLTPDGARAALASLKIGAVDYITIPDTGYGTVLATRHFKKRIVPLVKVASDINMQATHGNQITVSESSAVHTQSKFPKDQGKELVVISGCLGGVHSLYNIISSLPERVSVPIIIVQHMPKIYTREFAKDLDKITALNVREAEQNSILLPGQVYVAPGGFHIAVKNTGRRNIINLHRGPREMRSRPSFDVLLRSAAYAYDGRILGVFLSGGGSDGVKGARQVLLAGGEVLVQSKTSSLLWNLPGKLYAMDTGVKQYHIRQLGAEITERLANKSPIDRPVTSKRQTNKMRENKTRQNFYESEINYNQNIVR